MLSGQFLELKNNIPQLEEERKVAVKCGFNGVPSRAAVMTMTGRWHGDVFIPSTLSLDVTLSSSEYIMWDPSEKLFADTTADSYYVGAPVTISGGQSLSSGVPLVRTITISSTGSGSSRMVYFMTQTALYANAVYKLSYGAETAYGLNDYDYLKGLARRQCTKNRAVLNRLWTEDQGSITLKSSSGYDVFVRAPIFDASNLSTSTINYCQPVMGMSSGSENVTKFYEDETAYLGSALGIAAEIITPGGTPITRDVYWFSLGASGTGAASGPLKFKACHATKVALWGLTTDVNTGYFFKLVDCDGNDIASARIVYRIDI